MIHPDQWPAGLAQALCFPIEKAINLALEYDPATRFRLSEHGGQVIRIHINGQVELTTRLLDGSIQIALQDEAEADITLSGSASEFVRLIRSEDPALSLSASGIQVSGNTALADQILLILSDLDVDWEGMIEPFTGSLAAHAVGEQVRGFARWGKQTGESLRMSLRDYVLDETGQPSASGSQLFGQARAQGEALFERVKQFAPFAADKNNKD